MAEYITLLPATEKTIKMPNSKELLHDGSLMGWNKSIEELQKLVGPSVEITVINSRKQSKPLHTVRLTQKKK